jgi:hypothetical protein
MKSLLILGCAFVLLGGNLPADIAPDATGTTLFTVHTVKVLSDQPVTDASGQPQPQFDLSKKSLLTVKSLSDFVMGNDFKAVEVDLNPRDTKTLATLTGKYKVLAFVGADNKTIILSQITGQITDGALVFSDAHHSGPMALYLRGRFHIKPGTNSASVPVTQIKPTTGN